MTLHPHSAEDNAGGRKALSCDEDGRDRFLTPSLSTFAACSRHTDFLAQNRCINASVTHPAIVVAAHFEKTLDEMLSLIPPE